MWKFVTRGIRESLERRVCRTNVYSQSNDGNESISSEQQQPPIQDLKKKKCDLTKFRNQWGNNEKFDKKFVGPCLDYFAKRHYKHLGSRDKDEEPRFNANRQTSWSEAVGWSGVLALGYVVCQSLCIRRRIFDVDNSNLGKWKKKLIIDPHIHAAQILSNFLLPSPRFILSINKDLLVVSKQQQQQQQQQSVAPAQLTEETSEDLIDGAVNIGQTYGPMTAEETLKQAVDEFSFANEIVLSELELNSGNIAIEQERYEEAVQHFLSGAEMSSARCMFNLGVCYELGLGVEKDYSKAAHYYKKAATEGHADAMYNLGIYHAQGKGGLSMNLDAAKQWFSEAAEKGLIKAIKALELSEATTEKQTNVEHKVKNHIKDKTMKSVKMNTVSQLVNYSDIFKTNSIDTQVESDESSTSYDEGLSSQSPTNMFLDILGVHERRAMSPLFSVSNDGS